MEQFPKSPQYEDPSWMRVGSPDFRDFHVPRKPLPIRQIAPVTDETDNKFDYNDHDASDKSRTELSGGDLIAEISPVPQPLYTSDKATAATILSARKDVEINGTENIESSTTSLSPTPSSLPVSSWQKAYQEIRHFAGGLIQHPAQSTKHFSILRHSHGIVFYQGAATSIAISIFADAPLPADRIIWLQSKGWTGKAGMLARTVVTKGSWLDVTPTICVNATQLNPNDERAWQRDTTAFLKRADAHVRACHKLRETAIIHIPVEVRDGYYRLILCSGKKKVLCPSPVFRVLSTSASPGLIKGASLSTLPLEIGTKLLTSTINSSLGNAVAPVTSVLQQRIQPYEPSWLTKTAAKTAYNASGMVKRVDSNLEQANQQYETKRNAGFASITDKEITLDDGPQRPFPIKFTGKIESYSNTACFDMSVANLAAIPQDILCRLIGYYFGWIRGRAKEKSSAYTPAEGQLEWHQAIISVIPLNVNQLDRVSLSQLAKKRTTVYLIQEEITELSIDKIVEVRILGFIRSPDGPTPIESDHRQRLNKEDVEAEIMMLNVIRDIEITQSFLSHPAWSPEPLLRQYEDGKLTAIEKVRTSYADMRLSAQRRLDQVPLHTAGVRLSVDRLKGKEIEKSGFFVVR